MKKILKHFFLLMTLFYVGVILMSNDVRYEQASVMCFIVALFGFVLTATSKGERKIDL